MENLEIYSEHIEKTHYVNSIEKYYKCGSRRFKAVFRISRGGNGSRNDLYEHANGKWNFCDDYTTVGLEGEWPNYPGEEGMKFGEKLIKLFEDKIVDFYC